jgi:hypothetical protein
MRSHRSRVGVLGVGSCAAPFRNVELGDDYTHERLASVQGAVARSRSETVTAERGFRGCSAHCQAATLISVVWGVGVDAAEVLVVRYWYDWRPDAPEARPQAHRPTG